MKGMKFDKGKIMMDLIPTELLQGVGEVLQYGADKYEANNWRSFTREDFPRLKSAAMRHFEAYRAGEYTDQESGLPHLAHAITNLAFLLTLDKQKQADILAIKTLVDQLKDNVLVRPDTIYAPPRGGLVPATYVAHALGIKEIIVDIGQFIQGDTILVVDDISDSGETLIELMEDLEKIHPDKHVITAVVYQRYNTKFKADYVGQHIYTDEYLNFDWEVFSVENK